MKSCLKALVLLLVAGCVYTEPDDLRLEDVRRVRYVDTRDFVSPYMGGRDEAWWRWHSYAAQERGHTISRPADKRGWLPELGVMKIYFSSATNLPKFLEESSYTSLLNSYFCDRPQVEENLTGSFVYWRDWNVDDHYYRERLLKKIAPVNGRYVYTFVLHGQGDESGPAQHPSRSFNLQEQAHDICFYLYGGTMGTGYESNIVKIPKTTIDAAFSAPPKSSD